MEYLNLPLKRFNDSEFLKYMEIEKFKESYESHPNIGTFDFTLFNNRFKQNRMYGEKNILFFDNGERFLRKI